MQSCVLKKPRVAFFVKIEIMYNFTLTKFVILCIINDAYLQKVGSVASTMMDPHITNMYQDLGKMHGELIGVQRELKSVSQQNIDLKATLKLMMNQMMELNTQIQNCQSNQFSLQQSLSNLEGIQKQSIQTNKDLKKLMINTTKAVNDGTVSEGTLVYGTVTLILITLLIIMFILYTAYCSITSNSKSRLIQRTTATVLFNLTQGQIQTSRSSILIPTPVNAETSDNFDLPPSYSTTNLERI